MTSTTCCVSLPPARTPRPRPRHRGRGRSTPENFLPGSARREAPRIARGSRHVAPLGDRPHRAGPHPHPEEDHRGRAQRTVPGPVGAPPPAGPPGPHRPHQARHTLPALPATHDRATRPTLGRRARRRPPRRARRAHPPRTTRRPVPRTLQPGTRRRVVHRITRYHQSHRARTNSRRSHGRNTCAVARRIQRQRTKNAKTSSEEWFSTRAIRPREFTTATTSQQMVRRIARRMDDFSPFTRAQRPRQAVFLFLRKVPFRDAHPSDLRKRCSESSLTVANRELCSELRDRPAPLAIMRGKKWLMIRSGRRGSVVTDSTSPAFTMNACRVGSAARMHRPRRVSRWRNCRRGRRWSVKSAG